MTGVVLATTQPRGGGAVQHQAQSDPPRIALQTSDGFSCQVFRAPTIVGRPNKLGAVSPKGGTPNPRTSPPNSLLVKLSR